MKKKIYIQDEMIEYNYDLQGEELTVQLEDKALSAKFIAQDNNNLWLEVNHEVISLAYKLDAKTGVYSVVSDNMTFSFETQKVKKSSSAGEGSLVAPMPGKIFKVEVKVGQKVSQGQTLLIMEAMKMEHPIKAPYDGVVEKILFNAGTQVDGGAQLIEVAKEDE